MKSVAEVVLLRLGELTSRGGMPSGEENGLENVLDAARRFSLRLSLKNSNDEGHVS